MTDKARVEEADPKAKARAARPPGRATTKTMGSPAADPPSLQRQLLLSVQRDPPTALATPAQQPDGGVVEHGSPGMDGGVSTGATGGPAATAAAGTPDAPDAGVPTDASAQSSHDTPVAGTPNASMPAPNSSQLPDGGTANGGTPNASMPGPNSSQLPDGGTPDGGAQGGDGPTSGGQRARGGAGPSANGQGGAGSTGPGSGGQPHPAGPDRPGQLAGFDLVEHELAEHQAWGAATAEVGAAGSARRAQFIVGQIAEGAATGFVQGGAAGLVVTLANSGAARLLARRIPVPVIGSIIGGVIGAAGLINTFADSKNRAQLRQTVTRFGEGATGYEMMANSIDAVIAVLDVAANVIDSIGLICGLIAAGCWLMAGPTLGATSPAAATATSIAAACGLASTVISLVKLGLQPISLLFRSMHTFTSQADPRDVQSQGEALNNAAKGLGGTVGGYAGAAAGRRVATAAGRRWPRQPAPRPDAATRASQHPEGVQVRAERPALDGPDGPGHRPDGPDGPATRTDADAAPRPEAEAPPMTEAQQRAADRRRHAEDVNARRHEDIQQRAARETADAHQARLDTEAQIRNRMDAQQAANQTRYDNEMARIDAAEARAVNRATGNADPDGAAQARQAASQARERALQEVQGRNRAAEARAERDFQRVEQRTETALRDIEHDAQVRPGDAEYRPDLAFGPRHWRTRVYDGSNEAMGGRVFGRRGGPTLENMDAAMDGAQVGDITAGIFSRDPDPVGPGQVDSRYTRDNQPTVGIQGPHTRLQSAADRADALVERVNPAYPPPPRALPEDLAQQRALIAQLRQSAGLARGEAAEERRNEAETVRRAARIGEIQRVNESARSARTQHQQRTAETAAAAEGQRDRSREAGTSINEAGSRLNGVGPLVGLLRGWRSTTSTVATVLETVGASDTAASCRRSSRDASEFLGQLQSVQQTVSQAQRQQPAQQAGIERDLATTRGVDAQGQDTDTNISSMEAGAQCMEADNTQDREAAARNASGATADAERSEEAADREQDEHDRLTEELQDWAQRHRDARRRAVDATVARMESFGYRVLERTEW